MKTERIRQSIAEKVRTIRKERKLTQQEIAGLLGISQSRYSELENGKGSFSAEQLIILVQRFNVPVSSFVGTTFKESHEAQLQNTLSRLGARELVEETDLLPSEKLSELNDAILETVVSASTSRQILALAPVIVRHAKNVNFDMLTREFNNLALLGRFGWIVDSTIHALTIELGDVLSYNDKSTYRHAALILSERIKNLEYLWSLNKEGYPEDILDKNIVSKKTITDIKATRSDVATKWKIITRIKTIEFVDSLRWSRT